MTYIFIAIAGYILLALTNIFDKFILTKAVSKPVLFTFYSTVFVLPILVCIPFGVSYFTSSLDLVIAILAGFSFGVALWLMFIGFKKTEVSHSGPLVGVSTPFFVLWLGLFILGEKVSLTQFFGIMLLIFGSFLISYDKKKCFNRSSLWLLYAGLFYAISHVASKYIYDIYGFYSGLVWTRGFMGIFGLLLLFLPTIQKELFQNKKNIQKRSNSSQFLLVILSRLFGVASIFLIQYAISLGSVTIVNAMAGVQFASLIIVIALLTRFFPRIFKEKFEQGEIKIELSAVLIIAVGLAFIFI